MNRKGFIEIGSLVLSSTASGFICVAVLLIGISQLPAVKDNFREKKANILCEQEYKGVSCTEVSQMNKEEILEYIKDDIPAVIRTNGGNFVNGNMNG